MSRDLQQQRNRDQDASMGADVDVDAEHNPAVSRQASNAGLRREVQKKGPDGMAEDQVHAAADRGVSTNGGALPHMDKIQASFGQHDVSGIQAHVDPGSTRAMGAQAYATGNHVVFNQQPDLHTAAHEAAHVVQQQKGVHLKGGVGAEGDVYERQADAVADRVVAGKPAGDLLGPATGGGASAGQAVQQKPAAKAADPTAAHDKVDRTSYDSVHTALLLLAKNLHAWGPKLDEATQMNTSGDAGSGPAVGMISAIHDQALNDARRVGELIATADKNERRTLSPDVAKVQGAYTRFWGHANRAFGWAHTHGGVTLDLQEIQKETDDYTNKIGLDGQKLDLDTKPPEGDEKSLNKAMINDTFEAIEAALASVKSGNENDAGRLIMHVRYLYGIKDEHAADIKSHKSKLKTFLKQVDEARKDHPGVADRLAETHNQLLALLG